MTYIDVDELTVRIAEACMGNKRPDNASAQQAFRQLEKMSQETADGFARDLKFGGLVMTNLFAYRSTDPKAMLRFAGDKVGPENDDALVQEAYEAGVIICAWGKNGNHDGRGERVRKRLATFTPLYCLRLNDDGSPEHPLYLPKTLQPKIYFGAERSA